MMLIALCTASWIESIDRNIWTIQINTLPGISFVEHGREALTGTLQMLARYKNAVNSWNLNAV